MTTYLVWTLTGPMAAWGGPAPGGYRDGGPRPSKSGVIGYLAACLGVKRDDFERQHRLHEGLGFAVMIERGGQDLRDYHTAQSVTQSALNAFAKAHNKRGPASWGEALSECELTTILSERSYSVDPRYRLAVWWREKAEECVPLGDAKAAIEKPNFAPYLGRKACPLSQPPCPQILEAESLQAAFQAYKSIDISARVRADDPAQLYPIWCDLDALNYTPKSGLYERHDERRYAMERYFSPRQERLIHSRAKGDEE